MHLLISEILGGDATKRTTGCSDENDEADDTHSTGDADDD